MRFDSYTPDGFPEEEVSRQSNTDYPYGSFYHTGGGMRPGPHKGGGGKWLVVAVTIALLVGCALLFKDSVDWSAFGIGDPLPQSADDLDQDPAKQPEVQDGEPDSQDSDTVPNYAFTGEGATLNITQSPKSPGTQTTAKPSEEGYETLTLQQIYKKVIPSVVSIITTSDTATGSGTGIVMTENGYIITNEHVVDNAVQIEVLLESNETYTAVIVGRDDASDLAVLKIETSGLTPAEFGDSDQLEVGDEVVAIGNPLGIQLRGTMTNGIISAINRDLTIDNRTMTLIQTNAALNNGNSGGPLINCYGQVIGITALKLSSYYSNSVEGLGFAIPISTAKPIIDELIEKGYISGRPALGITGERLPPAVRAYYRLPDGVYIADVDPNSDAYAKGLMAGDIITAINGVQVTTTDELEVVKNQFSAGESVTLQIFRGGQQWNVDVTLIDKAQQLGS